MIWVPGFLLPWAWPLRPAPSMACLLSPPWRCLSRYVPVGRPSCQEADTKGKLQLKNLQAGGALRSHLLQPAPVCASAVPPPTDERLSTSVQMILCQEHPTSEMAVLITGSFFPASNKLL